MADKIAYQVAVIEKYLKKPGNELCADCKRPSPSWASINLGVFLCIKCSGCHREIGVHVTKIKSFNLDLWKPNILINFSKISNYWEWKLPSDFDFEKIRKNDYRLQDFIRDKYERMKYANSKKVDPMSLIIQGYDISQDVDYNSNTNVGSNAWEDEENISREKVFVKPKAGMSFGINDKTEKKSMNNNQPYYHQQQSKEPNVHTNKPLLDFDTPTVLLQNNQVKESNLIPQGSENIPRSNTLPTNPEVKKTGFQFIKKKNTNPNQIVSQPLSPIPTNEPSQIKAKTLLSFDGPIIETTNSNNENLIDLFSIQSQPTKAVQDLSNELMKVYQEKDNKACNTVKIDMNRPNNNINNYWPYMPNTKMIPMNNNNNQPPMMYPPMMNSYPMPINQPFSNPIGPSQYYINQINPMPQQPYVLDLYNPPKNDKKIAENPPSFTYNSNCPYNLNKKKDNDPFKNLVSFD